MPGIHDIAPKDEDANRHKCCAEKQAPFLTPVMPASVHLSDISLPISGGSVTELPATDAWLGAVIADGTYMD